MKDLRAALNYFFNKRVFLTIAVIALIASLYYQFGNFIFYASYKQYKAWFPKYYAFAYGFIWVLKLSIVTCSAWLILKYKMQLYHIKSSIINEANLVKHPIQWQQSRQIVFDDVPISIFDQSNKYLNFFIKALHNQSI